VFMRLLEALSRQLEINICIYLPLVYGGLHGAVWLAGGAVVSVSFYWFAR